jgi:putative tricarboxylic transport membrane protein
LAPEAANNAAATAALTPLLTLGVPGTAGTAMLFVALMIHGIRPGPLLFQEHPQVFWGIIASLYLGNIFLLALNLPLVGIWVRFLKIPYHYLVVIILIVCVIGSYSLNNSAFDVGLMMLFGVVGYFLRKGGFPVAPMVLAMILGRIFERSLRQTLTLSAGDLSIFIEKPIAAFLLSIAVLVIIIPVVQWLWKRCWAGQRV